MTPDITLLPRTIVLADDHDAYRLGLEGAIERHPALALKASCSDGSQAFQAIRRLRPAFALLDVQMPGLRGDELVRLLRDETETTFVLMSSHDDVELRAQSAGAELGLSKGLPRGALLAALLAARGGDVHRDREWSPLSV